MVRNGNGGIVPTRIGIVGSREIIEHVVDVGAAMRADGAAISLVGSAYSREDHPVPAVNRIAKDVDVILFAGPLAYDIAREAGALSSPATYVGVIGSSLYGAMLRAQRDNRFDLGRVSIDSVTMSEMTEAYREAELATGGVRVRSYDGPQSGLTFREFHEKLWRRKKTTGALTTLGTVATELHRAGVPVVRIRPTSSALRSALRQAMLMGFGSALGEAQVAVGVLELPDMTSMADNAVMNWWRGQELRAHVARILLPELRRAGATVVPRDDRSLTLLGTFGAFQELTNGFSTASFAAPLTKELGITPLLGIGLGRSVVEAEGNALAALTIGRTSRTERVQVVLRDGTRMELRTDGTESSRHERASSRTGSAFADLSERLAVTPGGAEAVVVDVAKVADVLGINPRTARRLLRQLTEEGLVWPVPPPPPLTPGRPRQMYRLTLSTSSD